MQTLPKITIMIPTYNQEGYIADAIESALAQDYPNLEVIVSDDCSTDNTGIIAQQYETDSRFKYVRNAHNLGRIGNYHNTLYTHATGEWVINLDGDDYYIDNQFISRGMNRILSQNNVVLYLAKRHMSKKINKFHKNKIDANAWLFDGKFFFKNYFKYGGFAHAGAFYKRSIAIKDGKCYTYNGIQSDAHGIIRYAILGNVIFAKDKGFVWRIHGNNATTSITNLSKYRTDRKCQRAIIEDLPSNILSNEETKNWLIEGQKGSLKQYIIDSLVLNPSWQSLAKGFAHYRFSVSYNIIIIKCLLRTLGFIIKS